VESQPGKGSTFRFEIPYQRGKSPNTDRVDEHLEYPKLKGLRILIAEDNEFNAMVLVEELNSNIKDSIIDVAINGKIALDKLASNEYDVIMMDILMPEMDGYETTKAIRKMDSNKSSIPIIAMTASTMKSDIEKCYEAGMDAFISKPFETEDLLQKLEELTHKN
jgi:CheY-like chemotaxis protein